MMMVKEGEGMKKAQERGLGSEEERRGRGGEGERGEDVKGSG